MMDLKILSTNSTNAFAFLPPSTQKALAGLQRSLPVLRANADLSTHVTIGMCIQTLAFILLPRYVAATPAVLYLFYKALYSNPGSAANIYMDGARLGKWSASVPNDDGTTPEKAGTNGVVCFILGTQMNHPKGVLAPGVAEIGSYFDKMWQDAEANAEKWGYLSHTPALIGQKAGEGTCLVTLSYWKSIDHLRDFAAHSVHARGRTWWERTKTQWPHLGIFHETYIASPGQYETIYENFHPFGMGEIGLGKGMFGKKEGEALVKANGSRWRSMDSRMGNTEANHTGL